MKKLFKTLAVLAAVAALGFGFASCSSDDGGSSSGSGSGGSSSSKLKEIKGTTVAVFEDHPYRVTFYADGDKNLYQYDDLASARTEAQGTYNGDPTQDGTITLTCTGYLDYCNGRFVWDTPTNVESKEFTIREDKFNNDLIYSDRVSYYYAYWPQSPVPRKSN